MIIVFLTPMLNTVYSTAFQLSNLGISKKSSLGKPDVFDFYYSISLPTQNTLNYKSSSHIEIANTSPISTAKVKKLLKNYILPINTLPPSNVPAAP